MGVGRASGSSHYLNIGIVPLRKIYFEFPRLVPISYKFYSKNIVNIILILPLIKFFESFYLP